MVMIDLVKHRVAHSFREGKGQSFLVVSAFTEGTPYEQEAEKLRASLLKHDVSHVIYSYDNLGDWFRNCCATHEIIYASLFDFPEYNITWIDADAVVVEYPELFERYGYDIGAYKRKGTAAYIRKNPLHKGYHWDTGTLFFKNVHAVQQFLLKQIELMKRWNNGNRDQVYKLNDLLESCDLNIGELPIPYSLIEGTKQPEEIGIKPVIIHHQASRRLKKILNG